MKGNRKKKCRNIENEKCINAEKEKSEKSAETQKKKKYTKDTNVEKESGKKRWNHRKGETIETQRREN